MIVTRARAIQITSIDIYIYMYSVHTRIYYTIIICIYIYMLHISAPTATQFEGCCSMSQFSQVEVRKAKEAKKVRTCRLKLARRLPRQRSEICDITCNYIMQLYTVIYSYTPRHCNLNSIHIFSM